MQRLPVPSDRQPDRTAVELRCSVAVLRDHSVLLVHRSWRDDDPDHGDWVLPGGSLRPTEGMAACARREAVEETGLDVRIGHCLFVLEVTSAPPIPHRTVELVFAASAADGALPRTVETFRHAKFVNLDDLGSLRLKPPLAGHLRGLTRRSRMDGAAYLGNLWRPGAAGSGESEAGWSELDAGEAVADD